MKKRSISDDASLNSKPSQVLIECYGGRKVGVVGGRWVWWEEGGCGGCDGGKVGVVGGRWVWWGEGGCGGKKVG